MYHELLEYISRLENDFDKIPNTRKEKLGEIADFISQRLKKNKSAKVVYICTHNSRRSHFCQIWTATLGKHFGINELEAYSGGTEVTAFNPRAIEAIKRAGFEVGNPGGKNPRYKIAYADKREPLICYSKRFDDSSNPSENFLAVMTCSDADQNCPIVPGAASRISLPYEDPKQADGTSQEEYIYDQRSREIATEMYFIFSRLN